jgi:hypothetical protein
MSLWRGPGHPLNTGLIVVTLLLASLPICMFISGFLGWERTALTEFRDAADLVPWPVDRAAHFALNLLERGATLSPFEGKFPSKLMSQGNLEAAALSGLEAPLDGAPDTFI